jgi:hypothetical protein
MKNESLKSNKFDKEELANVKGGHIPLDAIMMKQTATTAENQYTCFSDGTGGWDPWEPGEKEFADSL